MKTYVKTLEIYFNIIVNTYDKERTIIKVIFFKLVENLQKKGVKLIIMI